MFYRTRQARPSLTLLFTRDITAHSCNPAPPRRSKGPLLLGPNISWRRQQLDLVCGEQCGSVVDVSRKRSGWAVHIGTTHSVCPVVTAFALVSERLPYNPFDQKNPFNSEMTREDIPVVLGQLHFPFHLYQSHPRRHGCPSAGGREWPSEPPAHTCCLCQGLEPLTCSLSPWKKILPSLTVFAYS